MVCQHLYQGSIRLTYTSNVSFIDILLKHAIIFRKLKFRLLNILYGPQEMGREELFYSKENVDVSTTYIC